MAFAPAPGDNGTGSFAPPPPLLPPPPPPPTVLSNITYYNNQVSDNQIVTTLWVSIIVGVVAISAFSILRSFVKTYHTRLLLGSVWIPPPPLPVGGIHHLWSWLWPIFRTNDAELVHTAGLDALIFSWFLSLGIQIFLPVSILGAVMLLPICLSGDRVAQNLRSGDPKAAASTFSKLTVSNIARGSGLYWVVFAFVYVVTLYICWLLVKYYKAYVILRQEYLYGGENLINEWHLRYMEEKEAAEKASSLASPAGGGGGGGGGGGALSVLRNLFDPTSQVTGLAEERDGASLDSGLPLRPYAGSAAASLGRRAARGRDNMSMASGARSRHGRLTGMMRRRRMSGRSPSPEGERAAAAGPLSAPPLAGGKGQPRMWKSGEGPLARSLDAVPGAPGLQAPPPQDMGHRREGSELTREVLAAAGLAPSHGEGHQQAGPVFHEPGALNPGAGGLRSSLKGPADVGSSGPPSPAAPEAEREEHHVKGRNRRFTSHFRGGSLARSDTGGVVRRQAGGEARELIDPHLERSTSRHGTTSEPEQPDGLISKHERDPPTDDGRERLYKWWWAAEFKGKGAQASKPNVYFRKVINAAYPDGTPQAANAQSYAVLVTDVPDLRRERRRAVVRAQRRRWWWRLWYRCAAWFKTRVLLRRNVDRATGDFVLPPPKPQLGGGGGSMHRSGNSLPSMKEEPEAGVELTSIRLDRPPRAASATAANGHSLQVWPVSEDGQPIRVDSGRTDPPRELLESPAAGESAISPKSDATVQVLEGGEDGTVEEGSGDEEELDSELLVRDFFKSMFPDSFDGVLPVRRHKEVDLLLAEWNAAWKKLKAAENRLRKSGGAERPTGKLGCCGCTGERVDLIDHWAGEVRRLEAAVVEARQAALQSRARTSFFVFFTSQKDAAIAAQANLTPEDGLTFRVHEAPGPEEVNWQTLWMSGRARDVRGLLVLLPLAALIIFPIGLFSGAVNQTTTAICNGNSFLNVFYSDWYCQRSSLARSLVTGVLPSVLLMLWQNLVMPSAVYRITMQEGACTSLSQLDRRIGAVFFVWDIFNVLLGAMLGGSIFSQLGTVIKNPGSIASSIGTALPAASNFFINFIILQAFATQTVRMLIPHLGVIPEWIRLCGLCRPASELARAEALSPHSIRYGREMGAVLLVMLEAMAYAATSPIILPFALLYFCFAWLHWRYNMLYVSERCYESGGRAWDLAFQCMVWVLFVFELFTGFVLLANSAYAQATILWLTLTPLLYKFARHCELRYGAAVRAMPLETAAMQPLASVPAVVYMPPALRKGAAGWYPEYGKAWENFGMPTYTW